MWCSRADEAGEGSGGGGLVDTSGCKRMLCSRADESGSSGGSESIDAVKLTSLAAATAVVDQSTEVAVGECGAESS